MSAAEFAAVMGRLALSAATFRMGPVSRNYIESVASVYGGESGAPDDEDRADGK